MGVCRVGVASREGGAALGGLGGGPSLVAGQLLLQHVDLQPLLVERAALLVPQGRGHGDDRADRAVTGDDPEPVADELAVGHGAVPGRRDR